MCINVHVLAPVYQTPTKLSTYLFSASQSERWRKFVEIRNHLPTRYSTNVTGRISFCVRAANIYTRSFQNKLDFTRFCFYSVRLYKFFLLFLPVILHYLPIRGVKIIQAFCIVCRTRRKYHSDSHAMITISQLRSFGWQYIGSLQISVWLDIVKILHFLCNQENNRMTFVTPWRKFILVESIGTVLIRPSRAIYHCSVVIDVIFSPRSSIEISLNLGSSLRDAVAA